eukprot:5949031-Amphidinium_carterae.1
MDTSIRKISKEDQTEFQNLCIKPNLLPIAIARVACGRLDAWFEPDLNAWDSAAGALLVQEVLQRDCDPPEPKPEPHLSVTWHAGGRVTDCVGDPYTLTTRPVCASNGLAQQR